MKYCAARRPRTADLRQSRALCGNRRSMRRLALHDVDQLLLDDGEGAANRLVAQSAVGKLDGVAQERVARPGALSKIIHRLAGHHHIGHQRHAIGRPVAGAVKQVTDVRGTAVRAAHRGGGFAERAPGQRAQKPDRVEQVRLAGAIGPDDTGKGAEPDIGVDQIPEPGNPQSSQHSRLPTGCDAALRRPLSRAAPVMPESCAFHPFAQCRIGPEIRQGRAPRATRGSMAPGLRRGPPRPIMSPARGIR